MVFTREKNDTSNQNRERCFLTCEKNDTSNQKPQRCCSSSPSVPKIHSIPLLFTGSFAADNGDHLGSRIICGPIVEIICGSRNSLLQDAFRLQSPSRF